MVAHETQVTKSDKTAVGRLRRMPMKIDVVPLIGIFKKSGEKDRAIRLIPIILGAAR